MGEPLLPPSAAPAPRRAWLAAAIALAWLGLHVSGWIAEGGRLESEHVLTWGGVSAPRLVERGALVPFLVERGEWQRLVTGAGVVGQGALSLLLALWVFLPAAARLERAAGSARALLVLLAGTLAGSVAGVLLDAGSSRPALAGWDLVLAAVGAGIPLGLAQGGPQGRTRVSGALAFLALSVVLVLLVPGGRWIDAVAQGAGFAGGALALALLRPARLASPPGRGSVLLALAALAVVLACTARQAMQVAAEGDGAAQGLVREVERIEALAQGLLRARDPARVPPSERAALGARLDDLEARAADAGSGAQALRAYLAAMRPIATGDVRDAMAVTARLRRELKAWRPHEERLRQARDTRAVDPWR